LVQHLRNFAGPLRTYQESAKNVGDVAAIRATAAACLQKHPHLPTTIRDNSEEKGLRTSGKVPSHGQKPTFRPNDRAMPQSPSAAEHVDSAPQPFATIPFPRDHNFVARDDIIGQLYSRCFEQAGRVALVGPGGIGYGAWYASRHIRIG